MQTFLVIKHLVESEMGRIHDYIRCGSSQSAIDNALVAYAKIGDTYWQEDEADYFNYESSNTVPTSGGIIWNG